MSREIRGTFGFPVRVIENENGRAIVVDLGTGTGGEVVLSEDAYNEMFERDRPADAVAFRTAVLDAKERAAADWRANRGPDSPAGRELEQGTPPTSHDAEQVG